MRAGRSGLALGVRMLAHACAVAGTLAAATATCAQERPVEPAGSPRQGDLPDLGLEDLLNVKVYAASKFMQDVAQAPASVTIVASEEIRRHGYRTLADILKSVRGFYVTNDRNYSHVGVRGFLRPGDYNGRVLLLVNGHRMNDAVFEQALLGTESPIDVSLIDRVEVIRGPSSSLYGTSAFFAVINLITRTGHAASGIELEGETGSQAWRRGRLVAGGRTASGFEGLFAVAAFEGDGNDHLYYPEFDVPGAGDGVALDADRDRGANLYASGSRKGLTGQVSVGSRTKIIPTAPFNSLFNDARTQTRDLRGFADIQYVRQLDPRTKIDVRLAYDKYDYDGAFAYQTGLFTDDGHGTWLTAEGSLVRQLGSHSLTVGSEYRHNTRQDQSAEDETGVLLDDQRHSRNAAVFAEDELRLGARVLLNAGLRWDDYFGAFGGTLNPRIGLIVTPFLGSTVKALYGRAFRAPNPFELYYDRNAVSERLEPERLRTVEVVWEQRLAARLEVTGSAFENRVSGLIVQRSGSDDTIDGLYYRNSARVTARGLEVELQGELPGRVHARISQVFQSGRLAAGARLLSNSPRLLSTLVVDAPLPHTDALVAFNGYYIGARRRVVEGEVGGAFIGNLSITRQAPVRGFGVGVTVYNLFDTDTGDPGSVEHRQEVLPQDGRTMLARVTWRF